MMDKLLGYFDNRAKLNPKEIEFLKNNAVVKELGKNQSLLTEGDISQEFFFVIKGCVRLYYLSGIEEKTAYFYTENMFVSSYESFTKQIPAKHSLITVEPTDVVVFNLESVSKFLSFSPKFEFLARIIMEDELAVCQEIISSFVTQNAEQRYLDLMKNRPALIQRIPQHHIATYLGVSPETLSRIRKRIVKK